MFFVVSKLLSILLAPFSWIFLLLAASLFFKRRRKKLLLSALFVSYIFSNSFLFDLAANNYQSEVSDWKALEKFEAAVVLGGIASYDPKVNQINFGISVDRINYAYLLYQQKKIKKIVLSGGSGSLLQDSFEAEFLYQYLIDFRNE